MAVTRSAEIHANTPTSTGVNAMEFPAMATILANIVSQASGKSVLAPVDTTQFVSVAQTALLSGYDPVLKAISQVLSKTIFSVRPYYRKFKGLYADAQRYGNHVRKLQMIDIPAADDDRLKVCAEGSMDMYAGQCPQVLQTNIYGQHQFQCSRKIFKDQLDTAFSSPDEFSSFISMVIQNANDQIEQYHEDTARALVASLIAGKQLVDPDNVVHLLTEYNARTGKTFTAQTIKEPQNFPDFVRWVYSRINRISDLLESRTYIYHKNITGKEVQRHTPKRMQKAYISGEFIDDVDALVRTVNYDNTFMKLTDFEKVDFWQSITSPNAINVTPPIIDDAGLPQTPDAPVAINNVLGVLFDAEAIGYTMINEWSAPTPFNSRGGFSVMWWHFTDRTWLDYTENAVVLMLD